MDGEGEELTLAKYQRIPGGDRIWHRAGRSAGRLTVWKWLVGGKVVFTRILSWLSGSACQGQWHCLPAQDPDGPSYGHLLRIPEPGLQDPADITGREPPLAPGWGLPFGSEDEQVYLGWVHPRILCIF